MNTMNPESFDLTTHGLTVTEVHHNPFADASHGFKRIFRASKGRNEGLRKFNGIQEGRIEPVAGGLATSGRSLSARFPVVW
jgi:hypothetical protein